MDTLLAFDALLTLLTLTALEIGLGIDDTVFGTTAQEEVEVG